MSFVETMIPPQAPPPAPPKPYTLARFVGSVTLGIWLALGVGVFLTVVNGWDPAKFAKYGPSFLSGLGVTLMLVACSVVLGALLSLPVALGRMSKNKIWSWLAYGYVYFFRGTPLIAQLFLIYYGLGSFRPQLESVGLWWFFREAWNCALFTFTLNTAAYQAEILRGSIESVPRGQREGAAALGLPERIAFYKIILPQAMIVALRPYGNEIILMIKGSAIVAIVTVFDLMGETRRAFSRTFDYQMYVWAAILYLLMVEVLRNIWAWLENRLTRHLKR
ncbi:MULTISPECIES: ABC transporter permease [Ensifer]|jgi:polar amino acid transport system permease protein|uniref:ABC transporter permease n=1 Tax=Ensifer TaxID=106591 RepID=UPI00042E9117|nr:MULTISPECIES: ABC transporter permease [Ensifer]AHK44557.1 amino acid ABC transporter, permease protein [Ensifer adhaerens OV14]MDP9630702.1 polar amino acid transport system permease protein [Ensifer adhaerens]KQU86080.1 amino acid ABC transporter permease [Ensifer sp. Root31]KQW58838.1 amino acid ABC transporter permease [Ensifer sp. Root1252]KQW74543.1 amino acid ABC transporter permease [Ensifer sp. Root127]